jgi:hypothetical protein
MLPSIVISDMRQRGAELQLTAIFETWHIGDGNYPELEKGQLVNLSFEIEPDVLSTSISADHNGTFEQIKDAEYRFEGTVLKVYDDSSSDQIIVIQAGQFRFYVNSFPKETPALKEGDGCKGSGRLLLDHYAWVQFLSTYQAPPDLFYPLRVRRIRSVKIPEMFVSRHERGMSGPTSLPHEEYSDAAIVEIERMGAKDGDWLFYLVDFDDSDIGTEPIPLTFLG